MKFFNSSAFIMLVMFQLAFTSCLKHIALNSMGVFEKKVPSKFITNGEKKIVFLPMHHIGKKEFYDHVKHVTDSLIRDGYILYIESVTPGNLIDSLQKDTLYRKARKVTGVDLQSLKNNGGYLDTNKNTLNGMKIKQKLVNQPKPIPANYDSIRSKVVDATLFQLIAACEEKFGPIVLEQSDFEMKPGEMQKIPIKNEKKQYFLLTFRNELITESILKDQNKKIALMYGAMHFDGILENLQKTDKNYKEVEKL